MTRPTWQQRRSKRGVTSIAPEILGAKKHFSKSKKMSTSIAPMYSIIPNIRI